MITKELKKSLSRCSVYGAYGQAASIHYLLLEGVGRLVLNGTFPFYNQVDLNSKISGKSFLNLLEELGLQRDIIGKEHIVSINEEVILFYYNVVGGTIYIYAKDRKLLTTLKRKIRLRFRTVSKIKDDRLRLYTTYNFNGSWAKKESIIKGEKWDEIAGNYCVKVQRGFEIFDNLEANLKRGKIVILNGPPGTGKSYFIRAIGYKLRKQCDFIYVSDIEKCLSNPNYFLGITDLGTKNFPIIVFEDADLFISKSAKVEYNQMIARLLNMTDGILGQGLNFLLILSANENVGNIHEAISRPGRCLTHLEFEHFSREGAEDWLKNKGVDPKLLPESITPTVGFRSGPSKDTYSLANLYNILYESTCKKDNTKELSIA